MKKEKIVKRRGQKYFKIILLQNKKENTYAFSFYVSYEIQTIN